MTESPSVTGLLREAGRGDRQALDRLVPLVYETLWSAEHPRACARGFRAWLNRELTSQS